MSTGELFNFMYKLLHRYFSLISFTKRINDLTLLSTYFLKKIHGAVNFVNKIMFHFLKINYGDKFSSFWI